MKTIMNLDELVKIGDVIGRIIGDIESFLEGSQSVILEAIDSSDQHYR
jgi:hypothetical protein